MADPLSALLARATPEVAERLLGWRLVLDDPSGVQLVGRIRETEAYLATGDGASHSAVGPTARNRSMFLGPGRAYVYLIYGVHHCLNVVTGPEGVGEAVLLRAVEPLAGLELIRARRGPKVPTRSLCDGPGKLCQAFGIDLGFDGAELRGGRLRLEPPPRGERPSEVCVGPRIGISRAIELPLRFVAR